VQRVLSTFDVTAPSNEDRLQGGHRKMEELEIAASVYLPIALRSIKPEMGCRMLEVVAGLQLAYTFDGAKGPG
jgi:hypothetical protein